MRIHGFEEILGELPAFAGFDQDLIELMAGCARNEHFKAGDTIFTEGDSADHIYILREGDVAIEISTPVSAPMIVETLHAGDVLGWSWLVPPYTHKSDAKAQTDVRAISLDATCLRGKSEDNHHLGYRLFQNWAPLIAKEIWAARLQLLDVYVTKRT